MPKVLRPPPPSPIKRLRTFYLSDDALTGLNVLAMECGLWWHGAGNISAFLDMLGTKGLKWPPLRPNQDEVPK